MNSAATESLLTGSCSRSALGTEFNITADSYGLVPIGKQLETEEFCPFT